jgi:uncharacterized protein (DUF2141 family)
LTFCVIEDLGFLTINPHSKEGGHIMSKMLMLISGIIFVISNFAYGQEKFTLSGEIQFPEKKGVIIVRLLTQDEYENQKIPPPERNLMIEPNPQELKAKKVNFKFTDVPKGSYAIYAIQDLNENGMMDFAAGVFTKVPTEPYAVSGNTYFGEGGLWNDAKFKVDKDISGFKLKLEL